MYYCKNYLLFLCSLVRLSLSLAKISNFSSCEGSITTEIISIAKSTLKRTPSIIMINITNSVTTK